jgi:Leucine-rich repeat (LRR) protein
MRSLRLVRLDDNLFVEFPLQLCRLSLLEELWLSGNKLTTLPVDVDGIRSLRKLHVARNPITTLPAKLEKLELLEIDKSVLNEVMLLMHGIRDFGEWEQMVSSILEQIPGTKVPPLSYGRFDALRFSFPIWTREAPIK